ncbi:MAG TPA: hypothetical protein DCS24_06645 [Erythrobacter sp.]|nr:hypothetical protein [Erythrobacter sp.]
MLCVVERGIVRASGRRAPRAEPYVAPSHAKVDLTPWRFVRPTSFSLLSSVVSLYLVFSPFGVATQVTGSIVVPALMIALLLANLLVWLWALRRPALSR